MKGVLVVGVELAACLFLFIYDDMPPPTYE